MTKVLFRNFSGGGRLHSPLKTPLVMTPGFLKRLIILYLGSRFVIESDGLVVQGVRKDDGGVYTCRARVPETGELEERDIQLEVKLDKALFLSKHSHSPWKRKILNDKEVESLPQTKIF